MVASGPDRVSDERHTQNLERFRSIDTDLKKNVEQTGKALTEVSSVRHDVRNLRQTVDDFIWLYREEKKERKQEMDEQSEELRRLSNRFIWFTGAIAGFSVAAHFLFDLLSPLTRHILQ